MTRIDRFEKDNTKKNRLEGYLIGQIQPGQAVQTAAIFSRAIVGHLFRTFASRMFEKRFSLGAEFIKRNPETAGIGDAPDIDPDDGANIDIIIEMGIEIVEIPVVRFDHLALAVNAQDIGRPVEGAEHDDDPPVFFEMSDRFHPAAGEVEIGHGAGVDDLEGLFDPLRRAVEQAIVGSGGGGDEKDMLVIDEGRHFVIDGFVNFSHGRFYPFCFCMFDA